MRGVFLHVMAVSRSRSGLVIGHGRGLSNSQDTLGSVGVIISTILIKWTGWTGFDPIASLFIAVMIAASVIPLVIDSGRVLVLDVGAETESDIRRALAAVSTDPIDSSRLHLPILFPSTLLLWLGTA